jgi:hypothetical protein
MKLLQKTFPKPLKKQLKSNPKNDAEKHRKISPKIRQVVRIWFPFWSLLHGSFPLWRVFFVATCFSEPLGGTPLDQFWPPLGHPWSDFVDFLQDFRSKIGPKVKDSRATNSTNHTFKKTSKDSQTTLPIISSSKSLFTFVV